MRKYFKKLYLPAMLGASIEYYDIALYGFMAPILVTVFFPYLDKNIAYFAYFLFEFFATLVQVMGARFFGRIGDLYGRKRAMYLALIGISCSTFSISIMPTYHSIGFASTSLFLIARASQSFFLGGEYNGGAIYCMEHERDHKKYGIISGIYCAFTVSGIVIASFVASIVNMLGNEYFRLAYAISFILAIAIYVMRNLMRETPQYLFAANVANEQDLVTTNQALDFKISNNKKYRIFAIIVASTFFGLLYGMPTRVFNAILPTAIGISSHQIMMINSLFLTLYMILLIIFGALSDRYGSKMIMKLAVMSTIILAIPLMLLIETKSFTLLLISKAIFAALTAAFIGPFHAFAQNLFEVHRRYTNISTYYAIGKCFSTLMLAASFLIYDYYQNLSSLGIVLILTAIITLRIFYEKSNFTNFKAMFSYKY